MIQAARTRDLALVLVTEAVDPSYLSTTESTYRTFLAVYERALAALRELADRYEVGFIDAQTALYETRNPHERRRLFYDEVHLTAEGNAALARLIVERLADLHPTWFRAPR